VFRFVEPNGGRIFHDKSLSVKRCVMLFIDLFAQVLKISRRSPRN
jgi:hypothetical protein